MTTLCLSFLLAQRETHHWFLSFPSLYQSPPVNEDTVYNWSFYFSAKQNLKKTHSHITIIFYFLSRRVWRLAFTLSSGWSRGGQNAVSTERDVRGRLSMRRLTLPFSPEKKLVFDFAQKKKKKLEKIFTHPFLKYGIKNMLVSSSHMRIQLFIPNHFPFPFPKRQEERGIIFLKHQHDKQFLQNRI